MLNTLYDNFIKNPITSLIGVVTCGFTLFNGEASKSISEVSPMVDTLVSITNNVQTSWGVSEWVQFIGSIALMFYAKDFKKDK